MSGVSVGSLRRVGGIKVKIKSASGGPAQRAQGVALFTFSWWVAGFSTVVAVAGWVALLAWHLKATRNLPGAQPAIITDGVFCVSPVAPPAEPWLGLRLPGEESAPTSKGNIALRSNRHPSCSPSLKKRTATVPEFPKNLFN